MVSNSWTVDDDRGTLADIRDRVVTIAARPRIQSLIGWIVSAVVMAIVVCALRRQDWGAVVRSVPHSPLFWLAFGASYLALPVADWIVFRRLWGPGAAAFPALIRKHVFNALFFSYAGDGYFAAWAKRNTPVGTAVFSGIGDAAIASAIVNNVATLALVMIAWPMLGSTPLGLPPSIFLLAILGLTSVPLIALVVRRALVQTSMHNMQFSAAIYVVRTISCLVLISATWHFAMPQASVSAWLMLAAGRMVISRLPLVPDKDVVLAAVATIALGSHHQIAAVITLVAALTLILNAVLAAALALHAWSRARQDLSLRGAPDAALIADGPIVLSGK